MTKNTKPAILFLFLFLFLQNGHSQKHIDVPDYISQRFKKYCTAVPREEIFVHSDRDDYIAGENLWFNIYLIDRQSFMPSGNSRIAYFELLNPENRAVVQKRIRIDNGYGPGQIVLPDTLSTGTYTIRAYTSWMKNFLPYNCFMKDINIYNALNTKAFRKKLHPGDVAKRGGVSKVIQGTANSGMTLKVNNQKPDVTEILVTADESYRSQNNNLFYLFIQTHGIIDRISAEGIGDGNAKIVVKKNLFTSGINQITLFDINGWPICERYIYTPEKESNNLTLHPAESADPRSKISVSIESVIESDNNPDQANFSVSVAPLTNESEVLALKDYMIFGTEFGTDPLFSGNRIKISEFTQEAIDSALLNVTSNWIKWGTILADKLPSFRYMAEKDSHYISGTLLNSEQRAADSNEFLIMSTPGKEAGFRYAKTDNAGNFIFSINIDERLKDLIIQPDDILKNRKINIGSSFSDDYPKSKTILDSTKKLIPSFISKWGVNYQVKTIYGSSSLGDPLHRSAPAFKTKRFYGKPDIELVMADYIKLPVMQEVFFELLPGVFLKNKKSVYEISVADLFDNKVYESPPGLFVDGVMINDPSVIANLDPELVEKIDVVKEKYFVGDYLFFGIVNVITKAGDFSSVTLPDYAIRLPYRVTDPVPSFVSPDYSSEDMKNSRIPDLRNTLYWNPSVKPGKDGIANIDFWTSDFASDYMIRVEGVTAGGKPVSLRKIIRVR
jgi:hypothetical protein